jgi:hypothetical protein
MDTKKRDAEHGEGNYKAAREYQEAVRATAGTKKSKRAAKRAKEALQSPEERAELEAAEEKGRAPAKGVPEK